MASPPNSPGGRLMLCTTSSVTSECSGRSSQLGEHTVCVKKSETHSPNSQPFHAVAQRPKSDAQELGRGGAIEAGFFKGLEDDFLFDTVQVFLQRPSGACSRRFGAVQCRGGELKVFGLDFVARGKRDG